MDGHDHHEHAMDMTTKGHMDMGDGGGMMHGAMQMTFHFRSDQVILFDFWHPKEGGGMALSCFGVIILGILFEAIKWLRMSVESRSLESRRFRQSTGSDTPIVGVKPYVNRLVSLSHVVQTLLFVVQIIVAYLLMLIVMTYSVWLTLAVVLGVGIGYFFFGSQKLLLTAAAVDDSCCG